MTSLASLSTLLAKMQDTVDSVEQSIALAEAGTPKLKPAQLSTLAIEFSKLQTAAEAAESFASEARTSGIREEREWLTTLARTVANAVQSDSAMLQKYLRGGWRTTKGNPFRNLIRPEDLVVRGAVPGVTAHKLITAERPEFTSTWNHVSAGLGRALGRFLIWVAVLSVVALVVVFGVMGVRALFTSDWFTTSDGKPASTAVPTTTPSAAPATAPKGSLGNPLPTVPDETLVTRGKTMLSPSQALCETGEFACIVNDQRETTSYAIYLTLEDLHWGQWYQVTADEFADAALGEAYSGELTDEFKPGHVEYAH